MTIRDYMARAQEHAPTPVQHPEFDSIKWIGGDHRVWVIGDRAFITQDFMDGADLADNAIEQLIREQLPPRDELPPSDLTR